jgi:hypothetical protein
MDRHSGGRFLDDEHHREGVRSGVGAVHEIGKGEGEEINVILFCQ